MNREIVVNDIFFHDIFFHRDVCYSSLKRAANYYII